jgi:hypothetical protein
MDDSSNEVNKRIPTRDAAAEATRHPHEDHHSKAGTHDARCTVRPF